MSKNKKNSNKKKFSEVVFDIHRRIPQESKNQFSVLEKTYFPERYDENGVRKNASTGNSKDPANTAGDSVQSS